MGHIRAPSRNGAGAPGDRRRAEFEAIARAVHGPLTRYAARRVSDGADDVVAETLLVLWRRFDDVPPGAELPWCYGVARRCIANQRRGAMRHLRLVEKVGAQRQPAPPAGPGDGDPELAEALGLLDASDRELIRLWAWERLEPREIALALDISANAAGIRLHRARRRLEGLLAELGSDPSGAGHRGRDDTEGDG